MGTWACLFRGINVGGKNVVPMKKLVTALTVAGCKQVKTYIQSGNVVFRHAAKTPSALQVIIADRIEKVFGFRPEVFVLSVDRLERALDRNPFPAAVAAPNRLHAFFLAREPEAPDTGALEQWKTDNESFVLDQGIFYLYAPDGIGRSKLAARVERLLGVPTTARNWRTLMKLLALAREIEG